jgi:hypothetical protein
MRSEKRNRLLLPEVLKADGNPEGKGVNGLLADWYATEPRGIVVKPQPQVLAELFTSMLVLSAAFKYRPVAGNSNYLYWRDGQWLLSLIGPHEWSNSWCDGFAGTCRLQRDMTWTIEPSEQLLEDVPVSRALNRFFAGFAAMLDTDATLEEVLPFHVGKLPYFQRIHASALSRSVRATVKRGEQASISCRDWREQLPDSSRLLSQRG